MIAAACFLYGENPDAFPMAFQAGLIIPVEMVQKLA